MSTVVAPPAEPSHAVLAGKRAPRWLWALPPVAFVVVAVAYPLTGVVARTFTDKAERPAGLATWRETLTDGAVLRALGTTIQVAALSTIGCLIAGTFLALVLAYVPFPGAPAVVRLIEVVVSFPSFLIPLALGVLLGPVGVINAAITPLGLSTGAFSTSLWGVVLAEIAFYTPFVVRPVLAAFGQLPAAQINVASSLGAAPARIVARVILPAAYPALVAAASLTFLLTLNEFGIVLFTGAKDVITLPMLVYTRSIVGQDFASAAVLATVQLILSVGAYLLYRSFTRQEAH
ncbi:Binding-protein-dependent transport systems inner membrane component OS=Tsukamurella paurometabola(strain ATCC 8368 / DSM / CCUG 35730 / CIP 100753 / JCM 10117 / KCTC 9821 / NBRC 16120 / NCIMB 702349 / NCTC 13040)OX=521096 GN=Tpau_2097 PE=3 SV=1 [Tsukamurella paurometabola]|uniref:Binding-protein-dependent transport systems inner membrane component n=1 Tax=Tsukamurella paurometabola (strain ATCC 8368 / DSM 20162 / CCUG 35730 / CIP 100753 / JCM 10117 / KCTC 9821 / NBRC 16120 / NCIMB 702349 / NCTC 13040) TaxID=521096 RepID=D5UPF3_TSUPD|nr:2-aminoethylphosphonate ABC transporter permease subunit [Tsukamurella paurometabola]ADG78709.1 binding-protein-dependent transport systems inner membrane component [Tsukamurella paurometabola DSM 20162]SUP32832.1 Putrescine transport system permease protein PotH [Tsukamurella paurometabola]